MKEIILKAIKKAVTKGYGPIETADLILEYLDIAGDLGSVPPPLPTTPNLEWTTTTNVVTQLPPGTQLFNTVPSGFTANELNQITPPVNLGKVINQAEDLSKEYWTVDSLMAALMDVNWELSINKNGKDIPFKGQIIPQPRGLLGVGVVFKRSDEPSKAEFPLFFGLTEKTINPQQCIEDLKTNILQVLIAQDRIRNQEIEVKTPKPQGLPDLAKLADQIASNSAESQGFR